MDKVIKCPKLNDVEFYVQMYFFRKRDGFRRFVPIPYISFETCYGRSAPWVERMIVIGWLCFLIEFCCSYKIDKKGE